MKIQVQIFFLIYDLWDKLVMKYCCYGDKLVFYRLNKERGKHRVQTV